MLLQHFSIYVMLPSSYSVAMVLWVICIAMVVGAAIMGSKRGGIRATFTFIGLLFGGMLGMVLGGVFTNLLELAGLKHPGWSMALGPIIAFLLGLFGCKIAGAAIHKKIEVFYKYDAPEAGRINWERLNKRLGISLGVANGALYAFLISGAIYLASYLTLQASAPEKETPGVRIINQLGQDVQATGMYRSVGPFLPATQAYFDGADVLGLMYHNPLLESRLAHYAGLASLADEREFQEIANDVKFHEMWASQPTFMQFFGHDRIKAILDNPTLFERLKRTAVPDLRDLREYLVSGTSSKYVEKILGRWDFNLQATISAARRKPNSTTAEIARLRRVLSNSMERGTLSATLDHKVSIKGKGASSQGTWEAEPGSETRFKLSLTEGGQTMQAGAAVENDRLIVTKDGVTLVFEK
jgi:Colicin V production protein